MALLNDNKRVVSKRLCKQNHFKVDFSNVGGLKQHLHILRKTIVYPLLYSNVFAHFKIKAPRGILFHGPPGTGKTLVAGALASEMNQEGIGKVSFFYRKGADVLDKWVGESEKRLRDLFDKAAKSKPSIIFFDEMDGLSPVRSSRNDHIHASIVGTLLSLMDGLESHPGVIVIGATNRIDMIDPALRRPGRFDKELYFPIPSMESRKEILEVHTKSWKHKPSTEFLTYLADTTGGFCGCDLQALCSEAVMSCIKRVYPNLAKGKQMKIHSSSLRVEETDFIDARLKLIPTSTKQSSKTRKLSSIVKPLLERQLANIIEYIKMMWPHFLEKSYKYTSLDKRYAGRVILKGSNYQGVNGHIIPAVLQKLEHLSSFIFGPKNLINTNVLKKLRLSIPSVVVLTRVDEWWNLIEECEQLAILDSLQDIHAGLPILIIATCKEDLPCKLFELFYNNSSILVNIENPDCKERENFFAPLFFGEDKSSLYSCFEKQKQKFSDIKPDVKPFTRRTKGIKKSEEKGEDNSKDVKAIALKRLLDCSESLMSQRMQFCKNIYSKMHDNKLRTFQNKSIKTSSSQEQSKRRKLQPPLLEDSISNDKKVQPIYSRIFSELLFHKMQFLNKVGDHKNCSKCSTEKENLNEEKCFERVYSLWKHISSKTSNCMCVSQLELLYDIIMACLNLYQNNIVNLLDKLEETISKIDDSQEASSSDCI